MSQLMNKIPVTFIVGATAVGKTAFAIDLAKQTDAEIVSADSRYFYRGMDIGTAKPTLAERQDVPHHLIDVADPDETWSLALFQQKASEAIHSIHARGKKVIVAGGTGQYIHALRMGWNPPEIGAVLPLRAELEAWGSEIGAKSAHEKLVLIDPVAASNIQYQNLRRTLRALEVIFTTGRRFSDQRQIVETPFIPTMIGLKRERGELYARIDQRIEDMFAAGLIAEVTGLLAKGYPSSLPSMSAIGYREVCACLNHEITLEEAIVLIKRHTRSFVRRQANWFKESDPDIHWIDLSQR